MTTKITQLKDGILTEVFADEGKIFDLGDSIYESYVCVPLNFPIETLNEISIEEVPINIDEDEL